VIILHMKIISQFLPPAFPKFLHILNKNSDHNSMSLIIFKDFYIISSRMIFAYNYCG